MSKLVVYFSYGGITAKKAEEIRETAGASIFEIKAKVPYTDGNLTVTTIPDQI